MTSITKTVTFKREDSTDHEFEIDYGSYPNESGFFALELDDPDDYYGHVRIARLTRKDIETVREAIDQILREAPDE